MISFIVIGRNESENLPDCFQSIHHAADENNLMDYEVVYVDSDSEDNSIEIALESNINKIIKIKDFYNAAIARNVGAEYANQEILFFLDGDMFLDRFDGSIVQKYLNERTIIAGKIFENLYHKDFEKKTYERFFPKDLSGGAFLIKKNGFENIGGMDKKIDKGQDYDFFLRAKKQGYSTLKLDSIVIKHNTESYRSENRIKQTSTNASRYRAHLIRKHALSATAWGVILREFYPVILFITIAGLYLIFDSINSLLFISVLLFLSGVVYKIRDSLNLDSLVYEIKRQLHFVFSLFFFFPKNKSYSVTIIK